VKVGLLPVGASVDGTQSSALIFLLSTEMCRADVDVVLPLTRNSSWEGLLVLSCLAVVLLMRRLLMSVFSVGLRSSFLLWAEAGPLKGPRSRWTGIPRYPEHRQFLFRNMNTIHYTLTNSHKFTTHAKCSHAQMLDMIEITPCIPKCKASKL
jgi:hypothetical protein